MRLVKMLPWWLVEIILWMNLVDGGVWLIVRCLRWLARNL